MLTIPCDLPEHPFSEQLSTVAEWAGIASAPLLAKQMRIEMAFNDRRKAVPIFLECCPAEPWEWPAYEADIREKLAERLDDEDIAEDDDAPTADDVREFHPDAVRDMVEHIYDKLRANHHGLYRKSQLDEVKHLRPFWQISGRCGSGNDEPYPPPKVTRLASDAFWSGDCLPWNCKRLQCRCQVHSLSRIEMKRYVEAGCSPGDEGAAELLSQAP